MKQLNPHQLAVLEALRSGEYTQMMGELRDSYRGSQACFCAEGVIADLAVKAGLGTWKMDCFVPASESGMPFSIAYQNIPGFGVTEDDLNISDVTLRKFATPTQLAMLREYSAFNEGGKNRVNLLNDSGAFTFEQLAELLETEWQNA
ncbi:hypothetical protein [Deinococcus kurensis]|uniref:hypothetical protein n=1 Tax=Deinococcus kurensis TaxID=2662757 RepID=UPI0012D32AD1|nr:hypothetical protein [Deinococcus kurensis]